MKLTQKPAPGSAIKDPLVGIEMRASQLENIRDSLRMAAEYTNVYKFVRLYVNLAEEVKEVLRNLSDES